MDKLLAAIRADNAIEIDRLARELFVMKNGQANHAQISEFQQYAPCRINPDGKLMFPSERYGVISYYDRLYTFKFVS